jgi:sterol desaturase/sphingolipid hydroxylase (fatty acid hydroxylase superfamily)
MYSYPLWLAALSLLFLLLERLRPRRPQPLLRPGFFTDLAYLLLNSEYLGLLLGLLTLRLPALPPAHLFSPLPFPLQFLSLLLLFDFAQWAIHNLLHRVPFLWRIHQVHHSATHMDWLANWRFHGLEIVLYRSLLYPLAALSGFSPEAMFAYGILNTTIGHFAHSNLNISLGPLQYLINNPHMHLWHHNHPDAGPPNRNFAITLSLWDWLFRTAYLPPHDPHRLGFPGVEHYPTNPLSQSLAPFLPTALSQSTPSPSGDTAAAHQTTPNSDSTSAPTRPNHSPPK